MKRKTNNSQNQLTALHPQRFACIIQLPRLISKHRDTFRRWFWLDDPDPERIDTMVAGIMGVDRRTVALLEDQFAQGAQL